MATRRAAVALVRIRQAPVAAAAAANRVASRMEGRLGVAPRYFSDKTSGRVLGEEERAAENVYVQKMEREKLEKLRRKADKDKAETAKRTAAAAGNSDKKGEEAHSS